MDKKYLEERNLIDKKELLEHASLALLKNAKTDIPELKDWANYGVKNTPLVIYDINGKPLFYDFKVYSGQKTMGTVRTGASKILGTPVIAYEIGDRPWEKTLGKQMRDLVLKIRQKNPGKIVSRVRVVCYSYPKLGIMLEVTDRLRKSEKLIFDIADNKQVPIKKEADNMEGAYAWSYYDSLNEDARKNRLNKFEASDKVRLKVPEATRINLSTARKLSSFLAIKDIVDISKIKITQTRLLQFCTHYGHTESRSHHCFVLHAQQKNDYCAVATCQMILCYYRYYYSQDDIAPHLGYSAGSGCPSDQSPGYASLSNNHIVSTFDNSPTWEKARDHINALHPMKSGIAGHARACAGYSYQKPLLGGAIEDKKLYIYDPWPWNSDFKLGGSVYWEDWDSITHTNFVTTRLNY